MLEFMKYCPWLLLNHIQYMSNSIRNFAISCETLHIWLFASHVKLHIRLLLNVPIIFNSACELNDAFCSQLSPLLLFYPELWNTSLVIDLFIVYVIDFSLFFKLGLFPLYNTLCLFNILRSLNAFEFVNRSMFSFSP